MYKILFIILTSGWISSTALVAENTNNLESIPPSEVTFSEFLKVKEMPKVKIAMSGRNLHRLSHDDLVSELKKVSGSSPEIFARDEYYHVPAEHSARALIKWFENVMWKYDTRYRHEAWDCDDYALALATFCEIAAGHDNDLSHGFAWGTIIVNQVDEWARVAAGGAHELVLVHTENGFLVVEPQNGFHIPLSNYPNREHIRSVFLN